MREGGRLHFVTHDGYSLGIAGASGFTLDKYRRIAALVALLVAIAAAGYGMRGLVPVEASADAVRGKLHRARKAFAAEFAKTA